MMELQHLVDPTSKASPAPAPPSHLCQYCRNIFERWYEVLQDEYTGSGRFTHCKSIFALTESAKNGCYLCSQFLRNLETRGMVEILQGVTVDVMNCGLTGYRGYVMIISFERIISRGREHYKDCWLLELRFRPPDILYDDGFDENETDGEDDIAKRVENYMDGGHRPEAGSLHGGLDGGVWGDWTSDISRDAYSCKVVLIPSAVPGMHDPNPDISEVSIV